MRYTGYMARIVIICGDLYEAYILRGLDRAQIDHRLEDCIYYNSARLPQSCAWETLNNNQSLSW